MFINQDFDLQGVCPYCSNLTSGSSLDFSLSPEIYERKLHHPSFRQRVGSYCPFCGRSIKLKIWL